MLFIRKKDSVNTQIYPAIVMEKYSDRTCLEELLLYIQKTYSVTFTQKQDTDGSVTISCKNDIVSRLAFNTITKFPFMIVYDPDFNHIFGIEKPNSENYMLYSIDGVVLEGISNTLDFIFDLISGVNTNTEVTKVMIRLKNADISFIDVLKQKSKIIYFDDFVDDEYHYTICKYDGYITVCFVWHSSRSNKDIKYDAELFNSVGTICRFTNEDR